MTLVRIKDNIGLYGLEGKYGTLLGKTESAYSEEGYSYDIALFEEKRMLTFTSSDFDSIEKNDTPYKIVLGDIVNISSEFLDVSGKGIIKEIINNLTKKSVWSLRVGEDPEQYTFEILTDSETVSVHYDEMELLS